MPKIYLDVGHGGAEPSMVAHGIEEKYINFTVAEIVRSILVKAGVDVLMSRESDIAIGIEGSAMKCNLWGANYAYSIHHNGFNGVVTGYDIIYSNNKAPSLFMANAVAEEFSAIGRNKHGIWTKTIDGTLDDWYGIIREITAPCIIVEYCYMDSEEYKLVNTMTGLVTEATAIARGILKFLGIPFPVVVVPPVTPPPVVEIKHTLAETIKILTDNWSK